MRRVVAPTTKNRSDGQLLTAFLTTNDTDTFAKLVGRWGIVNRVIGRARTEQLARSGNGHFCPDLNPLRVLRYYVPISASHYSV